MQNACGNCRCQILRNRNKELNRKIGDPFEPPIFFDMQLAGLEPAPTYMDMNLNHARMPIPPQLLNDDYYKGCLSKCQSLFRNFLHFFAHVFCTRFCAHVFVHTFLCTLYYGSHPHSQSCTFVPFCRLCLELIFPADQFCQVFHRAVHAQVTAVDHQVFAVLGIPLSV